MRRYYKIVVECKMRHMLLCYATECGRPRRLGRDECSKRRHRIVRRSGMRPVQNTQETSVYVRQNLNMLVGQVGKLGLDWGLEALGGWWDLFFRTINV